jgi:hypothetical protein
MGWGEREAACRRGIMAAIVAAVAGCATSTTTFDSRVERPLAAPMTRLVVFEAVQSPFFDEWRLHGFVVGVTARLKSCGVTAQVEHLDELDLDRNEHITNALAGFHADAAMVITARGGDRTWGNNGSRDELRFALDLLEVESKRRTWHADATLMKPAAVNLAGGIGLELATSIVARLRDDGMLHACPPPDQPWPNVEISDDCHQERAQILREAAEIPDQRERTAKLKTLPRCP